MNALLEPIVKSPDFPAHLAELGRLWQDEQARRQKFREEITEDGKWEFINGEPVMHSPAKAAHITAAGNIFGTLREYVRAKKIGRVYHEKALVALKRNDFEPDVVFFGLEKSKLIEPDCMAFPPPDFVVEVLSESTEANDRGIKFREYEASGVGEYWIVDTTTRSVEQYVLKDGKYPEHVLRQGAGIIESAAVKGFSMKVCEIFLEHDAQ